MPSYLDDRDLVNLKKKCLSWLRLFVEVLQIAPPYYTMGEPLFRHIITCLYVHEIGSKFRVYDLFNMLILNLRFNMINHRIISSF
jgi:hypothetical protein